ncbi:MAG: pentapeptide repeat-containing protein [Candidatus Sericytochromatia bacterium]
MKKNYINVTIATLCALSLIVSCSSPIQNIKPNEYNSNTSPNSKYKIIGKVEFNKFTTKATIEQIKLGTTVSLIYSSEHQTNPNVTIATGLSDTNGNFMIDPNFTPVDNEVYILEASKRIGYSTNAIMSLRTYIKWTGSAWESITSPSIKINANTTALTIIDYFDSSISSADTIGKIVNDTITSIGSVSTQVISDVASKASFLIGADTDPTRFISYQNNKYFILKENPFNKNYLVQNKSCPNCDLMYEDLSNTDLSSSDLSNANLSNSKLINTNLSNSNLTGTNLANANLSGATWINGINTCLTGSIGKCLFPDILVNTYTTGFQINSSIAKDSVGNFVVAWSGAGNGDTSGVFARRYNSNGIPIDANEFLINTYTTGTQQLPSVAMDSTGNFVVSWHGSGNGDTYGIFARRFNSNGTPKDTNEFLVNSYTTGTQLFSAVAMDSIGNFVVTWNGAGTQDVSSIYAKRYSSNSTLTPIDTNDFLVNTYTTSIQQTPAVAMDSNGNFTVVWTSYDSAETYGVFGRRFSSNTTLTPIDATEARINSFTAEDQASPSVAIDSTGNFIVTWSGYGVGDAGGVFAKRFNSSGNPLDTSEFLVNTYTSAVQANPSVIYDNTGKFIITWAGSGNNDSSGVYARRYNPNGTAIDTSEFLVNSYTFGIQTNSNVITDNSGNFIVTWYGGYGNNDNYYGLYMQRYNSNVQAIN